MAERSKALDWNSSNILTGVRGFESHSLRQKFLIHFWRLRVLRAPSVSNPVPPIRQRLARGNKKSGTRSPPVVGSLSELRCHLTDARPWCLCCCLRRDAHQPPIGIKANRKRRVPHYDRIVRITQPNHFEKCEWNEIPQ